MANYAAPPARRIAYDRDDTQVVWWNTDVSGVVQCSSSDLAVLNGEADDTVDILDGNIFAQQTDFVYIAFIFPQAVQLLDARLILYSASVTPTVDVERSDNTTNGRDGTWTQEAAAISYDGGYEYGGVRPKYRLSIANVGGAAGHVGWRFKVSPGGSSLTDCNLFCLHLYAEEHGPTHRLAFWHPTLDQEYDPDIDFGDLARGATSTKQFRVKNLSGSQTASGIELTSQHGVSYDGGQAAYTLLSEDDSSYYQTIDIGDLAAGAISPVCYLKASPPASAELSTLSCRVVAEVTGGWA